MDVAGGVLTSACTAGVDYTVVAREHGAERSDLPIFTTRPGLIQFDESWTGNALEAGTRDLEAELGLPGGLLLPSVLTPGECAQLIVAAESMGFTEDAPVSLGRHIRHNENHVWIADESLVDPIFDRVKSALPQTAGQGRALAGLNQRWRLYKYGPGDVFKPHTDGDWPGSAVIDGRLHQDAFGDRRSVYTFVLYLNDDFEGGETAFYLPKSSTTIPATLGDFKQISVQAMAGAALIFPHGADPQSPLHEGTVVPSGTKYIIRTDVLYLT